MFIFSGFFAHVATLSEVQEQVLKYLPVMSRSMVMKQQHDINFTPVYNAFGVRAKSFSYFFTIKCLLTGVLAELNNHYCAHRSLVFFMYGFCSNL